MVRKKFHLEDVAEETYVISNQALVDEVMKPSSDRIFGEIPVRLLHPNPFQPRKVFQEDELQELADSILHNGLIEVIVVRHSIQFPGEYDIVCGERRWRAIQEKLAWSHIRAEILLVCTDRQMQKIAFLENLQRKDLTALEIAQAYNDMLETTDAEGKPYTVRSLAAELGVNKDHVFQYKSLLSCPLPIKELLEEEPHFPIRTALELSHLEEPDYRYLIQEYKNQELRTAQLLIVAQEKKRLQQNEQERAEHAPKQKVFQEKPSFDIAFLTLQQKIQAEKKHIEKMIERLASSMQEGEEEKRKSALFEIETLLEGYIAAWKATIRSLLERKTHE